ncbi:uncharacterized protein Nmag_0391 [Natrialba magadii ATCC 43099]|uniref:Uncharacterized protein n=1 Tax=Natrialba magadii (strain ATCC 43099 / DSM 3394 / CCM 3739 / CIP 104546 / IAM 13178 / JCM 8861 / NBRC 102185 / NCIMB 2190 / MS3) TaxID=547559 RepID=D3SXT9_NATMM|nr:hypothetical protein [Natrialba magadii]ADD03979.1 uncharacterized protein Nmag_0391 [Natrialba magadii ATCC 43099]ELY33638.1 hypothetical protein C500_02360 [Natrialba magadii ATCC 43099]
MEHSKLEQIRNTDDNLRRLAEVCAENGPVEAMADPSHVQPVEWVEAQSHNDDARKLVAREASEVEVELGEAVLVHQTKPNRAESILKDGFGDPLEHVHSDLYHVPGSVRYGCVFLWPHSNHFGTSFLDRGGAAIICRIRIEDVQVSAYGSYSALCHQEKYDRYEKLNEHLDRIPPEEYNKYHVYPYRDYLKWIEDGNGEWPADSLYPYVMH